MFFACWNETTLPEQVRKNSGGTIFYSFEFELATLFVIKALTG